MQVCVYYEILRCCLSLCISYLPFPRFTTRNCLFRLSCCPFWPLDSLRVFTLRLFLSCVCLSLLSVLMIAHVSFVSYTDRKQCRVPATAQVTAHAYQAHASATMVTSPIIALGDSLHLNSNRTFKLFVGFTLC